MSSELAPPGTIRAFPEEAPSIPPSFAEVVLLVAMGAAQPHCEIRGFTALGRASLLKPVASPDAGKPGNMCLVTHT